MLPAVCITALQTYVGSVPQAAVCTLGAVSCPLPAVSGAAVPACSKVQTVQTSDSPQQVLEQLQQARFSQLPIVDSNGNLVSSAFCSTWQGVWTTIATSAYCSKYLHHHHPFQFCKVQQRASTLAPHRTETL